MSYLDAQQNKVIPDSLLGRPDFYPNANRVENLVFFIQRNQNTNTVIYTLNYLSGGVLNMHEPLSISWLRFDEEGNETRQPLNYIQKKLAYGYNSNIINHDLIEFTFVSYDILKFYLAKQKSGRFELFTTVNGKKLQITHLYVHADDIGIFPQVKFVEFFGLEPNTLVTAYQRITFD